MDLIEGSKEESSKKEQSYLEHVGDESNNRQTTEQDVPSSKTCPLKKPLAFHMSFLALLIMGFICALDATVLGVALPVCFSLPMDFPHSLLSLVHRLRTSRHNSGRLLGQYILHPSRCNRPANTHQRFQRLRPTIAALHVIRILHHRLDCVRGSAQHDSAHCWSRAARSRRWRA